MKQIIRKGIKDIIVDEVPDPLPSPHHVIIQPVNSLISSGTETADIHRESLIRNVADNPGHLQTVWNVAKNAGPLATLDEVRAKLYTDYAVLGYSGAGVVVGKHDTVRDLAIGDRVAYGGEGTGHGERIRTGRNLVARMPEGVKFEDATFTTLGSIALNSVRIATISVGDVVAVIGLGLVGQLAAQLVRIQGGVVIAVDLRPERVELARKLGADHALLGGDGLRESIASLTNGRGVDCVILAAAAKTSSAPARQALEITRDRGRIVVVGAVRMEFPWGEMYIKEIQLFMARAYGPGSYDPAYERRGQDYPLGYVRWTENRNMEEFLRLLGRQQIDVGPLVTHRFPLDRGADAYNEILKEGSTSLGVLLEYPETPVQPGEAAPPPRTVVPVTGVAKKEGEIGFALIGAGNLAKWAHLPALKKMSGVSLRAIHSSSGARGKGYANRFGASYCASDLNQILEDASVDAVLIASRNAEHASQAEAALRAGKHVLVEKPMALTEEECRRLLDAVASSGKHLSVGFNRRFAPYYLELKQAAKRRSGPAVIAARVNSPGISGNYWMADPAIGGAILGEACHFVDLFRWLLDAEIVSVSAYSLPADVQEPVGQNNMAASFAMDDGSVANLTYCTVGSATSGGERVEIFAQGIGAATENFKRFTLAGGSRRNKSSWFAEKGYAAQLDDIVDAIRTGRSPRVTARDGAQATLVCLRMLESARDRGPKPCV